MKLPALSIRQPWAWAIAAGYKPVENRSWRTNFRGRFLIHAGKQIDMSAYRWMSGWMFSQETKSIDFRRGGIVGMGTITDCVEDMDSLWFSGPFGFVIKDAQPLPYYPVRGRLGFFEVDIPHLETIQL